MNVFQTILLAMLALSLPVFASVEVYDFEAETDRVRYTKFLDELRCPKCKNNNLAGTNSKIAIDLRRQLQLMIKDGKDDEEIIDYMVTRYGDFVLYRPRLNNKTVALWLGPLVFLGIGSVLVGVIVWRRRTVLKQAPSSLSEEESDALKQILASGSDTDKSQQ